MVASKTEVTARHMTGMSALVTTHHQSRYADSAPSTCIPESSVQAMPSFGNRSEAKGSEGLLAKRMPRQALQLRRGEITSTNTKSPSERPMKQYYVGCDV
jgi:hypothetical protein